MTRRALPPLVAFAVLGSQAGHLLAYQLRFGLAAQQVQSSAAHAYFPALAKTILGSAAAVMIVLLLMLGVARIAGRRSEKDSAPPYLRLLALLFTIQLAIYATQESMESSLTGGPSMLLLWGSLGQLPVAAAGAIALRWLLVRVRPALVLLVSGCAPAFRLVPFAIATVVQRPVAARIASPTGILAGSVNRRGPPSF